MATSMSPSDLNTVARLVMTAERCGPEVLYNAERFDKVFRWNRFAGLDSQVLKEARRIVEAFGNRIGDLRVNRFQLEQNTAEGCLDGERFSK
jgi:hypothetical protein